MLIRIRLKHRTGEMRRSQNAARSVAALLTPSALVVFVISFWSIAANLRWTTNFFVSSGAFSHWQVWLIVATALLLTARLLNRYAGVEENESE